jgi:type II secretory pathway pseudopilin PulG
VESQRIEQMVVIALLVILAVGCITVLRPFSDRARLNTDDTRSCYA